MVGNYAANTMSYDQLIPALPARLPATLWRLEGAVHRSRPRQMPQSTANLAHWFLTLADAAEKLEAWRTYFNEVRPHGAIGQKTPISLTNHRGAASPPP